MNAWRRLVAWSKARPFLSDLALALLMAAFIVPSLWRVPTGTDAANYRDPNLAGLLLLLGASLPLAWRRSHTMLVAAITFSCTVAYESLGFATSNAVLGVLIALYTVAAHRDRVRSGITFVAALVGLVTVLMTARWKVDLGVIVSNTVIFFGAWLSGEYLKTRRAYVASLQDRADRAEQLRAEEARRAVVEERTRIARELHDVVAHSMSVMIVQAGAARAVLSKEPEQATAALQSIESTGREAMTEMRRLLGVLREDQDAPAALGPQPGVDDISNLVEPCAQAGVAVTIEVDGERRDLPVGVDLSAYRIVQEALTNVRKHAGPASATVHVRYGDGFVDLEVGDDGRGAASDDSGHDGHGLIGMRERVEMFGGELHVGPRVGGGFLVRAHLPIDPAVT